MSSRPKFGDTLLHTVTLKVSTAEPLVLIGCLLVCLFACYIYCKTRSAQFSSNSYISRRKHRHGKSSPSNPGPHLGKRSLARNLVYRSNHRKWTLHFRFEKLNISRTLRNLPIWNLRMPLSLVAWRCVECRPTRMPTLKHE